MNQARDIIAEYLHIAEAWYENQRAKNGAINTNVMTTGLVVSQMVTEGLPIDDARLYSSNKGQVRGLSGSNIAKILARHGEERLFTREGGRTSRGTVHLAAALRDALNDFAQASKQELDNERLALELEAFFTRCVQRDYFDKQKIKVDMNAGNTVSSLVGNILHAAAQRADKPGGTVLQHLVGAKLQLRFPDLFIGLDHANAADQQTCREGDFQLGSTAFHVTVAPMEKLIDRCVENRQAGFRPIILTPSSRILAARQMIENIDMPAQISVQAAEDFIGNNIEEIAVYEEDKIRQGIARLVRTYNERIAAIEVDKSLMIEEPAWIIKAMKNVESGSEAS